MESCTTIDCVFYAVVLLGFILCYVLNRTAYHRSTTLDTINRDNSPVRQSGVSRFAEIRPLIFLTLWLLVTGILAWFGTLSNLTRVPPPAMIITVATTIVTAVLAFSTFGKRLATHTSLVVLIGLHCFRLPLELVLHALYEDGRIPKQMTYAGMNFDIATGIGAIILAIVIWAQPQMNKKLTKILAWIFNIGGTLLLINIVAIAVLSMPLPVMEKIRPFQISVVNTLPIEFPYIWLPLFLVQLAWFGHLLLFRRLRN